MKKMYTKESFKKEIDSLAIRIADTAVLVREGHVDNLTLLELQNKYIDMFQYYLSTVCTSNEKIFVY